MKAKAIKIVNYRGIKEETVVSLTDFNCIVGKNDVGKSTILRAVDMFLNDKLPTLEDVNSNSETKLITISMSFCVDSSDNIDIDGGICTTFNEEEFLDNSNCLTIKKQWDCNLQKPKCQWFLVRKKYADNYDFVFLPEKELMKKCKELKIETNKGNGEIFNNKEKRLKLRQYCADNNIGSEYFEEQLPLTGSTRQKNLVDEIKKILPSFEYFRADSSLEDSDASIQKFFKDRALKLINDEINTTDIEEIVKRNIGDTFEKITNKINSVLSDNDKVEAKISFDWTKLISTSFRSAKDSDIPLSSRGDGFRRITMMSYFEMLSEENNIGKSKIYGFEEPETFLHPEIQLKLSSNLQEMAKSGYQVFITTHSPSIVSEVDKRDIIHISKYNGQYNVNQDVDIQKIVEELGIKGNETLVTMFHKTKLLFLVEGPDDVKALTYVAEKYKEKGKIESTFDDLNVTLIPVGGCSSINHWKTFNLIKKLDKPYFILLDSDKTSSEMESPNLIKLKEMGYGESDCQVLKKREIECYIPCSYFNDMGEDYADINYGDWDDVKDICKKHKMQIQLGGKKVCEKHFQSLSFDQLRLTFCMSNIDSEDEFLNIYNIVKNKIV